jgi:hypothetical protein
VDATPEIKAAYREWCTELTFKRLVGEAEVEARQIVKGCQVKVVRGRKIPVGTVGKLVAIKDSEWGQKVGIATSDEMVPVVKDGRTYQNHKDVKWSYMKNIERVDVPAIRYSEVLEKTTNMVESRLKSEGIA